MSFTVQAECPFIVMFSIVLDALNTITVLCCITTNNIHIGNNSCSVDS